MQKLQLVLRLAQLLIVCAPVNAWAGTIVRDQYWPANSDGVWDLVQWETVATVIDVTQTGLLDRVELYMGVSPRPPGVSWGAGDLYWSILSVSDGKPAPITFPSLASGFIPSPEIDAQPYEYRIVLDVSP